MGKWELFFKCRLLNMSSATKAGRHSLNVFWSNIVPETKAENMWVKVPETGLGHNFWWFISLFWAIGVITVIIFPYRLWKPMKKDIFEKRKGTLHDLLQSYLVMCDLKTSPTCLNRHHLTRREGTLPNKKVSHMSESYIMWYFWGRVKIGKVNIW